jgi:DNA repair protein RadA
MSKKNEMAIEDLPGIGAATAEKLREAGYHDLMGIAVATPGELTESVGMGEA